MIRCLVALLTGLASPAALAGAYAIDSANSQLNFISIKNNAVAETHRFASVSGGVAEDGRAQVFIALSTVDTGIEIRDTRMRELLFDVAKHPLARLDATVPAAVLEGLADGVPQQFELPASLELAGQSQSITLAVNAVSLTASRVMVSTQVPVLIDASQFGLTKGVNQLREIAGLQAIATAVPVSFVIELARVSTAD